MIYLDFIVYGICYNNVFFIGYGYIVGKLEMIFLIFGCVEEELEVFIYVKNLLYKYREKIY